MPWAAALLLVAGELWTASEIRALRETEDVRDASAVEQALEPSVARERVWQVLAPYVERHDRTALLAAARLDHDDAIDAVGRFLRMAGSP